LGNLRLARENAVALVRHLAKGAIEVGGPTVMVVALHVGACLVFSGKYVDYL
jgi:hypothetical protein